MITTLTKGEEDNTNKAADSGRSIVIQTLINV